MTNDETLKDPHSALERLWPNDVKMSEKLAEEKHEKQKNLSDLGDRFRLAREELGYNISDLDEHTGLSFTELVSLEQGQFGQIEQQEYIDYYVHSYAALLGLDADEILRDFQQNFYTKTDDEYVNIHDETQYETAFADEAKSTLEALEVSNYNSVETTKNLHQQIDSQNTISTQDSNSALKAEPLLANQPSPDEKSFPWVKLILVLVFAIVALSVVYYISSAEQTTPPLEQTTTKPTPQETKELASIEQKQEIIPDVAPIKKIGTLEKTIIQKGSDNLNAATVTSTQKPLILPNNNAVKPSENTQEKAPNDALESVIKDALGNQAAKKSLAKITAAPVQNLKKSIPLPASNPAATSAKPETVSQLPISTDIYSLRSTKSSWVLIEDRSQILFSGELVPEKFIPLPKIKDVIISLGDAGIINVYKGQKLIGKLGKADESLDLVSLEQRLSQIEN